VTVPASEIATRNLGRPLVSGAMLGAFAAVTGAVTIRSLVAAIDERLPGPVGLHNAAAATETYEFVRVHAQTPGGHRAPTG
jgi:pyruvate ferredoxin oxidoreductase gamma subunit